MSKQRNLAMTILDRRAIANAIEGEIVPAMSRVCLDQTQDVTEAINNLHTQAESEVDGIRRAAYQAGLTAARRRYEAEKMAKLVRFHQHRNALLSKLEDRVGELALTALNRIAPQLDAEKLLTAFVAEAIEAAQAEHFLLIRVHPESEAAVTAAVRAMSKSNLTMCPLEVETDASIDPLSCVVESELGAVKTGWTEQLAAMRDALERENATGITG